MKQPQSERERLAAEMRQLQEQHDTLMEKIARLEEADREALDGVAIGDLEKAATARVKDSVELAAARMAVQELRRRFDDVAGSFAKIDYEWRRGQTAVMQVECDRLAGAAAETLGQLHQQLEELRALEQEIIDRYQITPYIWFSAVFRGTVEHQLDLYAKEWAGYQG